jgi:hypothetical protein
LIAEDRLQTIGELGESRFAELLADRGVGLRIGPFDIRLRNTISAIVPALYRLYRHYPLLDTSGLFNFHVGLVAARSLARLRAPKVRLVVDGRTPHEDLPMGQALAVLEWGMNLVIALRAHSYLMLHSAAVERSDRVMLFPAWPGSGK